MIIADLGSTHGNDIGYLRRAIDFAKGRDNLMLKLQAFAPDSEAAKTNIALSPSVYNTVLDEAEYDGVTLFASAFDNYGLTMCRPPYIKFAYPMRHSTLLKSVLGAHEYTKVFVTYDWLDTPADGVTSLLMPAPGLYPVLHKLDILGSWFERFDGLSDHTISINQSLEAIDAGAMYIEKHVALEGAADCPDKLFAITELELEELCEYDSKNCRIDD